MSETRDAKVSKPSVHYRPSPMGSAERCGTCSMFRGNPYGSSDGECTLVAGEISPVGLCDRYDPAYDPAAEDY